MKIALALMSLIFMMFWFRLIDYILRPYFDSIELLSIISFLGSVLFLLEARKVLPRWYLAFPLSISLLALIIVNFWINFSGKELLSDHIGIVEAFELTLLMLLTPFSVLVFLSLHRHPDSMDAYLGVLYAVSMLSMVLLLMTLVGLSDAISSGGPTFDAVVGFQALYWCFLMPIVGICFLIRAITYKDSEDTVSTANVKPTQN
jgi:hypothetical protein